MKEIEFKGKAMEYFWHMACQYSFNCNYNWYFQRLGKSTKTQIFFNNTKILKKRSFLYHATGWQILKGKLYASCNSYIRCRLNLHTWFLVL